MGPKVKNMDGLRREDAARDNMRQYGFDEVVINETIKELVELYGDEGWKLIEDGGYSVLLTRCLERQEEQSNEVAAEEEPTEERAEEVHRSVRGASNSQCGWVSEEEETDEDSDDDDDRMIQLVPEPLCEELEQLLREVRGGN